MKKIQEKIIQTCIKVAKKRSGALIVFGDLDKKMYNPMVNQNVTKFSIMDNPKLFESLALLDGAVIINKKGYVEAYGVRIKSNKILNGFGTRHSAGLSVSLKGATAFIVSEEDSKIRVFKKGKKIMQIDTLEKGIEKRVPEINKLLESIGIGTLGVVGVSSIGLVGVSLIPGVIVFGGVWYLIKKLGIK